MNLGDLLKPERKSDLPERALVFVASGGAMFLAGSGPGIESDREAGIGVDEIGPTRSAPYALGLWIWDGTPRWVEERCEGMLEGCVPEYYGCGTWRRPTTEEITRVCSGDISYFTEHEEEAT